MADATDVAELYPLLARPLERIVRFGVTAPDVVIEDACQTAWTRLLCHTVRPDAVMSWLVQTATREARRSSMRRRRELPIEAALSALGPNPEELVAHRQQLARLSTLKVRQQRVAWLKALGLSYEEIAAHEACTKRTVERQLLRARKLLQPALEQ
jgi:RNA polymerase sigma factor (sigma-70 family)